MHCQGKTPQRLVSVWLCDKLPVLHFQHPIRDVEPAVVVSGCADRGDSDHGVALRREFRQQGFVEIAAELRVLLSRPSVHSYQT